jgi:RNA polymerase sigma factor (sigma-70 family)
MGNEGDDALVGHKPFARATDEELAREMAREQGDDDAAWREFFARYGDLLMRFIGYCGPLLQPADREEVFSDTIIRVQGAVHRYRSRAGKSFISWVYKIAQNVVRDRFREGRRSELVSIEDMAERLGLDTSETTTTPEAQHAQVALDRALEQLVPRHQALLGLSRAGLSDEEIGHRLGMGADTVRKVRYKALARLKELLIRQRDALK